MQNLARSGLAAAALAALIALLFGGHAFLNYDTAYALFWGDELAHGRLPELDVPLAPTPKPLVRALVDRPRRPGAVEVLSFVFLGLAGVLVFWLGARLVRRRRPARRPRCSS